MAILLLSLIGSHWVPSISNSKSSAEHPERTSYSDRMQSGALFHILSLKMLTSSKFNEVYCLFV